MDTPTITGKSPQFTNNGSSMYPYGNNQLKIRKWWVPLRSAFVVRPLPIPLNNQHQVSNRENTQREISMIQNNNNLSINSTNIK